MSKIITIVSFAVVLMSVSCGPSAEPIPPSQTGQPYVGVDQDGGASASNTVDLCGVSIRWDYIDQTAEISNHNDQRVPIVYIGQSVTGYDHEFYMDSGVSRTIKHRIVRGETVGVYVYGVKSKCIETYLLGM